MYLASGMTNAGGGLGFMIVGVLTEWLVDFYGWRQSLLLLSGVGLQMCVAATLVFQRRLRKSRKTRVGDATENHQSTVSVQRTPDNDYNVSAPETIPTVSATVDQNHGNTSIPRLDHTEPVTKPVSNRVQFGVYLRDKTFWCLTMATLLINMASISILIFLKDILSYSGCLSNFKIHLVCVGIGSVMGHVMAGIVAHYTKPPIYFAVVSLLCSLNVFGLCYPREEWQFHVLNLMFGFCHGQLYVLKALIFAHAYGRTKMTSVFGFAMGFGTVTCLIGPPLGGKFFFLFFFTSLLCPSSHLEMCITTAQ